MPTDETTDPESAESAGVELQIPVDTVCALIELAREFDVQDVETDAETGSDPADDGMIDVLEARADDPVAQQLAGFIDDLSEDAQIDLVTLFWLGRGDGGPEDWPELREDALRARQEYGESTARYLMGTPLLGSHLEAGLAALGRSCEPPA